MNPVRVSASPLPEAGGFFLKPSGLGVLNSIDLLIFAARCSGRLALLSGDFSGCSSVGRVHVWGACGRRFKSCHPDINRFRRQVPFGTTYEAVCALPLFFAAP